MAIDVPPGAFESLFDTGTVDPPMPTCTRPPWYHLRPPLYPPLIWRTSLSSSISTLGICTTAPEGAAGPLSRAISVHCFLSYPLVASNSSDLRERGSSALTVAYSAVSPRVSSTRSSQEIGRASCRERVY